MENDPSSVATSGSGGSEFSTFRPAPLPLYTNQYFQPQIMEAVEQTSMSNKEQLLEEDEDEGINTMTPPKTPAEDYSQHFGEQMQTSL